MTVQESFEPAITPAGMMPGFGNHFATEAVPGALPLGRNSPQKVPFGLYAEQVSGTAFTAPRGENRRTWLYRMRPSADHPPFRRHDGGGRFLSAPFDASWTGPNRLRWDPLPIPDEPSDFLDSLVTWCGNGDAAEGRGVSVHLYACTRSMEGRTFSTADGELLIVPQQGAIEIVTELGVMTVTPRQVALVPRGLKFRVALIEGPARGYVCENHGALFRLPELGPIGSNGLANPRDFETPTARYEASDQPFEIVHKYLGKLWTMRVDHSPFDVVAWHGNLAPWRYDLGRFNTINTVSFDHPDPSIFTVLTSPSDDAGAANCDFVIFPQRWTVAEDTFRPPWFHRNVMSEFMGLVEGRYDAKAGGFVPGGASLHNCMSAHGPDRASYEVAIAAALDPRKTEEGMAFMFESRYPFHPTELAAQSPHLQGDYDGCWRGFPGARLPSGAEGRS